MHLDRLWNGTRSYISLLVALKPTTITTTIRNALEVTECKDCGLKADLKANILKATAVELGLRRREIFDCEPLLKERTHSLTIHVGIKSGSLSGVRLISKTEPTWVEPPMCIETLGSN